MVHSPDPIARLRALRDSVDNIDAAIVHMLAERFNCTAAIERLKAMHGLPTRDVGRDAAQVSRLRHLAAVSKLDPEFAESFLVLVTNGVDPSHKTALRAITHRSP